MWLGRNRLDQQYYAVKLFPKQALAEIRGLQEYKARVREHPHLVRIEHVGEVGDLCYYIMPLADDARGTSPLLDLDQYEALTLARYLDRNGRLDMDEVLSVGRQKTSSPHALVVSDFAPQYRPVHEHRQAAGLGSSPGLSRLSGGPTLVLLSL